MSLTERQSHSTVEHIAFCRSKVWVYNAASVSLTVLENAQYYCDTIPEHSVFLGKTGAQGKGFTRVTHMKNTTKLHIYLHCEKGLEDSTAYIIKPLNKKSRTYFSFSEQV